MSLRKALSPLQFRDPLLGCVRPFTSSAEVLGWTDAELETEGGFLEVAAVKPPRTSQRASEARGTSDFLRKILGISRTSTAAAFCRLHNCKRILEENLDDGRCLK